MENRCRTVSYSAGFVETEGPGRNSTLGEFGFEDGEIPRDLGEMGIITGLRKDYLELVVRVAIY